MGMHTLGTLVCQMLGVNTRKNIGNAVSILTILGGGGGGGVHVTASSSKGIPGVGLNTSGGIRIVVGQQSCCSYKV